jgi:DNA mismatch repair protein MutS2
MAIIDDLTKRQANVVVTTHLTQLKAYALGRSDAKNVSVEFHPITLKPTYRLLYDLPGESHAIQTAERIGMAPTVIAAAQGYANMAAGGSTRLLESLRAKLSEVESLRQDVEAKQRALEEELAKLRDGRERVIEETRVRGLDTIRQAEREIAELLRSLKEGRVKRGPRPRELLKEIESRVVEHLGEPLEKDVHLPRAGTRVKIKSLGRQGVVRAVLDRRRAEVSVGNVTILTSAEDLVTLEEEHAKKNASKKRPIGVDIPFAAPQWEVNVIGRRVDDALPIVEKALDSALLGGLSSLRIIHGKGTGRLRKAVWDYLTEHSLVRSFRSGEAREGGEGVTVVELGSEE